MSPLTYKYRSFIYFPSECWLKTKIWFKIVLELDYHKEIIALFKLGLIITQAEPKVFYKTLITVCKDQGKNVPITLKELEE